MKKDRELIDLEEQLRHLKSTGKQDPYVAREIEDLKKEIRNLKKNKDGRK